MPETLEVEVIAIDGAPPPAPNPLPPPPSFAWRGLPDWKQLAGRLLKLDRRWWPLWVLLGVAFVSVVVIAGAVAAAGLLTFAILRAAVRVLLGGGRGNSSSSPFFVRVRKG